MSASSKLLVLPFLSFLVLLIPSIQSNPVKNPFGFIQDLHGSQKGQTVKGLKDLKLYLEKFGYLNHNIQVNNEGNNKNHTKDDEFDDSLESAIKKYQRRYGLNVTGGLDAETVNMMMKPRCGQPDIINNGAGIRINVNVIWPATQNHLKYRILTGVQVPGTEDLNSVLSRAFNRWAKVSRFTFEEVPENAEIFELEIGFHDTNGLYPGDTGFDGRFGTTAHATFDGKFHYDKDEGWSSNPGPDTIDLESVAVHEIGHLLGLGHSPVPEAVMYGIFGYGTTTKRDLHPNDIEALTAIYGPIRS
ncbi:Peptidase M10, metallopeptidase [Corchorus olitorius]|uniref:Peptidase M10, metallopeptidase n=1 Tax=Corchorus olitorius TaxID=93759 RepID=A0A1R3K9P3_9ROSI|nr:Peptidase M10, metallopeptidase [Corchorus olitorius]